MLQTPNVHLTRFVTYPTSTKFMKETRAQAASIIDYCLAESTIVQNQPKLEKMGLFTTEKFAGIIHKFRWAIWSNDELQTQPLWSAECGFLA